MKLPIVAGNWKMNTTLSEAISLISRLRSRLEDIDNVEKIICPPFTALRDASEILGGSSCKIGAQNLYFEGKGAFTGEISASMIKDLCEFVIIGHSERRQLFGENDTTINKKIRAAIEVDLTPILCVGEQLGDRKSGLAKDIVRNQIKSCLAGISEDVVIAYEPIWAIGTGLAADPAQIEDMAVEIKKVLKSLHPGNQQTRPIIYGGSVTPSNVSAFMQNEHIDGALVGSASLIVDDFVDIVEKAQDAKSKSE